MTRLRVVVRDPDQTEMVAATAGEAKGFAKHMIRDSKGFDARPNEDGTWTFVVYEINYPNRWEAE